MSALLQAPEGDLEQDGAPSDHKLVAAVRRGDDRAFEALYERYHRRIHAYVFGMVKDHQRAEDVTQEVFVSALRRMRATERPIAFKPWMYEIAKNACIDQFRRSRRAEEISYDADDGLAPSDYGRLVSHEPVPDAALVAKQQLDDLCGAFGGLSDAHHRILVLRELEGLSYREIGEKMGMSRPAVESTLFRARRRLTEEYDELASGQRCQRIQSIIATAGSSGRLGARDTRRLARHVAHCQPCRREALAAGVDDALVARRPVRTRVAEKVAALLPFPFLLRGRKGGGSGEGWASQLPMVSDQAAAGTAKLAAAAVVLVAGLGAGVDSHTAPVDPTRDRGSDRPARTSSRAADQPSRTRRTAAPVQQRDSAGEGRERNDLRSRSGEGSSREGQGQGQGQTARGQASAPSKPAGGSGDDGAARVDATVDTGAGGGAVPQAVTDQAGGATDDATPDHRIRIDIPVPQVELPTEGPQGGSLPPEQVVNDTVDAVQQTADSIPGTVEQTTESVQQTTEDVTGELPVQLP